MPLIGGKMTVPVAAKKKEAIKNELGIPGDKVYVEYRGTHTWGWNGSNFQPYTYHTGIARIFSLSSPGAEHMQTPAPVPRFFSGILS